MHPSIILKDFHHRLRPKAIQKCDLILCCRQELRESVHAFVQNSVSTKQMVNATPYTIELWKHLGESLRSWRIKGGGREEIGRKNKGEKKGQGDWGKEGDPSSFPVPLRPFYSFTSPLSPPLPPLCACYAGYVGDC